MSKLDGEIQKKATQFEKGREDALAARPSKPGSSAVYYEGYQQGRRESTGRIRNLGWVVPPEGNLDTTEFYQHLRDREKKDWELDPTKGSRRGQD